MGQHTLILSALILRFHRQKSERHFAYIKGVQSFEWRPQEVEAEKRVVKLAD